MTEFPDKNLSGKICLSPFVSAEIAVNGDVRVCGCAAWLPTVSGNILDNSLLDIINNTRSQLIKQSVLDGNYKYCDQDACGVIGGGLLNNYSELSDNIKDILTTNATDIPTDIFIAGDNTCNLSCPSCRDTVINNDDVATSKLENIGNVLAKNLFSKPTDKEVFLTLSTTGELFASPMLLAFVNNIRSKDFPNLKLKIQTNGLLSKKRWHRLGELASSVAKITVTIDASNKETYEKLRRGGKWEDLLENLDFLKHKKVTSGFALHTRMVVQLDNFEQMTDFYKLSQNYSADVVEYVKILPWSHLSRQQLLPLDVFNPRHEKRRLAQQELDLVKQLPNTMFFNGL